MTPDTPIHSTNPKSATASFSHRYTQTVGEKDAEALAGIFHREFAHRLEVYSVTMAPEIQADIEARVAPRLAAEYGAYADKSPRVNPALRLAANAEKYAFYAGLKTAKLDIEFSEALNAQSQQKPLEYMVEGALATSLTLYHAEKMAEEKKRFQR